MQLWGGVECTINRVGDAYFRQLERSGHHTRVDDLDRFAGLGIEAIRYPVLWEQHAPDGEDERGAIDWGWADARLSRLRALGVRPIVGLVHHGSGPARTSLVDPAFGTRLAVYARAVAERFPWVEDWTPVNEPLTTARFSALYGVWYPHARDPRQFARAIVSQCRATQLAMRAIRTVNPAARLIQTEDLGRIHATAPLAAEAELHNERRWLGFDLLCGRVDPQHPFWPILCRWGIAEHELDEFREAPCPPDVVGINYYLTSDRFLDHRVERYPDRAIDHAGEQFSDRPLRAPLRDPDAAAGRRHAGDEVGTPFVDVEAVRASSELTVGVGPRLREAWLRYELPLAVTESHLGCTREEQMRWLLETWRSVRDVRREGADVRAVTVWSLLGAFDWNSLVTRDEGFYEPGAFDVRAPAPRPTAIATLARQLARGIEPDHPVLEQPGWWRRPERLFRRTENGRACVAPADAWASMRDRGSRPLVITGAGGTLGSAFARVCDLRGIPYRLLTRRELELTDGRAIHATIAAVRPWAVVNCAGWVGVDDAEQTPDACRQVNATGPAALAAACARVGAQLVAFSSDLVFDGVRRLGPYVESDAPAPLGVYGQSKAEMEAFVLGVLPEALVVRTSAFFGPWDDDFVTTTLRALACGETVEVANDVTVSPTYVVDLVHATLDLLLDGAYGLWHLVNEGAVTWAELARLAAERAEIPVHGIRARPLRELHLRAARPRYSALRSERGQLLPSLDSALDRYVRQRAESGRALDANDFRPHRYHQAAGRL